MKTDLDKRKQERMRAYQLKLKYKDSTARKKAGADEQMIEDLKTGYEEIEYRINNGRTVRIWVTLMYDKELHYQYPGSAFIRVREVNSGKLHVIPVECWIERIRKRISKD